jgi:hypothetical protein
MPEDYQQYDTHQKREFWKNHVERWQQSGLSQRAYCRKYALKADHFYYSKAYSEPTRYGASLLFAGGLT